MKVIFLPAFLRRFKKLPKRLQEEAFEKIEMFKSDPYDPNLHAHKLKGPLSGRYSFSVNFKYRVVFNYVNKDEVALLSIGDHDIYE